MARPTAGEQQHHQAANAVDQELHLRGEGITGFEQQREGLLPPAQLAQLGIAQVANHGGLNPAGLDVKQQPAAFVDRRGVPPRCASARRC